MKIRTVAPLVLGTLLASCAGDAGEATTDEASVVSADEQEITALIASWQQHYNLHHPSMVADFYTDDAFRLHSAGADDGRDNIVAALEAQIAGSPTATVGVGETMAFGDQAVAFGSYRVETMTAEGAELLGQRLIEQEVGGRLGSVALQARPLDSVHPIVGLKAM